MVIGVIFGVEVGKERWEVRRKMEGNREEGGKGEEWGGNRETRRQEESYGQQYPCPALYSFRVKVGL